jgi:hypothetical protein
MPEGVKLQLRIVRRSADFKTPKNDKYRLGEAPSSPIKTPCKSPDALQLPVKLKNYSHSIKAGLPEGSIIKRWERRAATSPNLITCLDSLRATLA